MKSRIILAFKKTGEDAVPFSSHTALDSVEFSDKKKKQKNKKIAKENIIKNWYI